MRRILLVVFVMCALAVGAQTVEVQPDRPGALTGPTVLDMGVIQWESGVDFSYSDNSYSLSLPTTMFRFGLGRAELRVDYTGSLSIPDNLPKDSISYAVDAINIGTKIKIWGGSDEAKLKWIPAASLLATIALPTPQMIRDRIYFLPSLDLLFENEVTDWFSIGYNVGARWETWSWQPSLFAGLGLYFQPHEQIGLYAENYNLFAFESTTISDVKIECGLSYLPHPRVQLDLYGGFSCYHSTPTLSGPKNHYYVGLGVAWLIYHPNSNKTKK